MKYAKFDSDGMIAMLIENPAFSLSPEYQQVPETTTVGNSCLKNGELLPRTEVELSADRTVLSMQDDHFTLSGFPSGDVVYEMNGIRYKGKGPNIVVSTIGDPLIIVASGEYSSDPIYLRCETDEVLTEEVRLVRNDLLTKSDWTQMPDADLTDEQKKEWAAYRTALRNMFDGGASFNIDTVVWPTKPQ